MSVFKLDFKTDVMYIIESNSSYRLYQPAFNGFYTALLTEKEFNSYIEESDSVSEVPIELFR
jgi:hypothetical protein